MHALILDPRRQLSLNIDAKSVRKDSASRNVPSVSDVSALGNIYTLNLSNCGGVYDVSALRRGIYSLDLSGCGGVRDVSPLGKFHILNLFYCCGINDVSALGGVHTLDLSNCDWVSDVSALRRLIQLWKV